MRDGRFNTSKCRGKLQKMGMLYTHPPKQPRPLQHVRALKKFFKKSSKKRHALSTQAAAYGRPLVPARRGPRSPSWQLLVAGLATADRLAVARLGATAGQGAVGGLRPAVADRSCAGPPLSNPPAPSFLLLCPQIFPHVVNSSSLAPAHALTSPRNFKHP
jgi:hypothetical protein